MMNSPFGRGRFRIWRETDAMSKLPKEWGAYRFKNQQKEIDYIGITSNLYNRISKHRSLGTCYDPDCHHVEFQLAEPGTEWQTMCEWEKRKIAQHSPHLTTYAGGNGRPPRIQICGEIIEVEAGESIEDAAERVGLFDRLIELTKQLF